MNRRRAALAAVLSGELGILALLVLWYGWLSPSPRLPAAFVLLLLGGPLLLPLRGLLHGRRYTVKWSLFLALGYFTHGVLEAYSTPADRWLALLEIGLSLLWFVGGIRYVRDTRP
ncbi:DUF2069 domain-containing protein [Thiohalobacter sp. IOR34]|uniref:DUF2069 domain-containing protein n=1 Tax=Thiohalobacter sp. IOR34 TaxID=3057176 RepID=UPI0025B262C9|nr:DUF2069 domain-containing protein [Thiohalobacter sp. IOR34]WJW76067.1 DUF2069 domain-containing protein [Thiohalobacter sp. IOR34]